MKVITERDLAVVTAISVFAEFYGEVWNGVTIRKYKARPGDGRKCVATVRVAAPPNTRLALCTWVFVEKDVGGWSPSILGFQRGSQEFIARFDCKRDKRGILTHTVRDCVRVGK